MMQDSIDAHCSRQTAIDNCKGVCVRRGEGNRKKLNANPAVYNNNFVCVDIRSEKMSTQALSGNRLQTRDINPICHSEVAILPFPSASKATNARPAAAQTAFSPSDSNCCDGQRDVVASQSNPSLLHDSSSIAATAAAQTEAAANNFARRIARFSLMVLIIYASRLTNRNINNRDPERCTNSGVTSLWQWRAWHFWRDGRCMQTITAWAVCHHLGTNELHL